MAQRPSRKARAYADRIADHVCDRLDRAEVRELLAEAFDAGRTDVNALIVAARDRLTTPGADDCGLQGCGRDDCRCKRDEAADARLTAALAPFGKA